MSNSEILTFVLASAPPAIAVLIGILIDARRPADRFDAPDVTHDIDASLTGISNQLGQLRAQMDRRFDEQEEVWRTGLRRIERVFEDRPQHLKRT